MSALAPASADATGVLYQRYAGRIFGYCLSLLGSREDAEDAVQVTFVNAQRGLRRGVVPQFELAWLFKIARNVCYNAHSAASRRLQATEDFDALEDVLAAPERRTGISVAELTDALSTIPERQRRALLLREFRGLSYEEIAAELGITVPAVETLLYRARRAVAEQLVQPSRTHARGGLASAAGLLRWFFQGGATPIKLAAATMTVAATATFAIVPHSHARETGPVVTPRPAATRAPLPTRHPVSHSAQRPLARHVGRTTHARSALPVARTAPPVVSAPPAVHGDASVPKPSTVQAPTHEAATPALPTITAPPVTTVPTVPDVSLPPLNIPQVQLPLDAPKLPDLPKLPTLP